MRAPDDSIVIADVLKGHYDPVLATTRVEEIQKLFAKGKAMGKEERTNRGLDEAYDLRPWNEFPDTDNASITSVVLQNLTRGWFGSTGGPTKNSLDLSALLRDMIIANHMQDAKESSQMPQ